MVCTTYEFVGNYRFLLLGEVYTSVIKENLRVTASDLKSFMKTKLRPELTMILFYYVEAFYPREQLHTPQP